MGNRLIELTKYLRSAVAAQANMGIDFKTDYFSVLPLYEVMRGRVNKSVCNNIFNQAKQNTVNNGNEAKKTPLVNVIICAKTIKILFEANTKLSNEFNELTGIYYIPAILNEDGLLLFNREEKKLPWFPREYLMPMIEPKLAIGNSNIVDRFMSNHVDRIEKIGSWFDYMEFSKEFYKAVAETPFEQNIIRNMDKTERVFELESNAYLFLDKTVSSTFHIINLYNHLLEDDTPKALYNNFISTQVENTYQLIENDFSRMQVHCGQMNGEYPLSLSQREAVNHFNCMNNGEILAVNGPPGTGKTTLLQTIVADMYVKRAIKKEEAPLIVASSTNNQAVTNIIASFGNVKKIGISNLEQRWIGGVNSFATYFPSVSKGKEAQSKGYQYTNQKGDFFVSDIEDKENIEKSKIKLMTSCNEYFGSTYDSITACQEKLHEELLFIEQSKRELLSIAREVSQFNLNDETIDKHLEKLLLGIEQKQGFIINIKERIIDWESLYKKYHFM